MPIPTDADPRDPGWVRVGMAIREDRTRRGWTRRHLAERVVANGGSISETSLALIEQGRIDIPGGVTRHLAMDAWDALGWTQTQRARIQIDGHALPPLEEVRKPTAYQERPASTLTTRLRVIYADETEHSRDILTETVQEVRTCLLRLATVLPALETDTATHRVTAARAVRQLLTGWFFDVLAEAEDADPAVHTPAFTKGTPLS